MPRSLADSLFERLQRSFPADQAYARADWADASMPAPVAHFLDQLLTHHSRREARRLRRARTDWVNYDHPEVEQAVRTFFEAVEAHTQVPAAEWEKTLRQATYHSTAYLVRPIPVLSEFVFGDRDEALPLSEVFWRMDFFGPYDYLRDAVHAFAQKKDLDSFPPDRFEPFLKRIDERVTEDFGADRWLRLLDPLFDVARRATDRERLPVSLLQTFFAGKNAAAIEQRLGRYEAEGHDAVGPKALYRLIEEARGPSEAVAPGGEEGPPRSGPPETTPPEPDISPEPADPSDDQIWGVAGAARPEGSGGEPQPTADGAAGSPSRRRTGTAPRRSGSNFNRAGRPPPRAPTGRPGAARRTASSPSGPSSREGETSACRTRWPRRRPGTTARRGTVPGPRPAGRTPWRPSSAKFWAPPIRPIEASTCASCLTATRRPTGRSSGACVPPTAGERPPRSSPARSSAPTRSTSTATRRSTSPTPLSRAFANRRPAHRSVGERRQDAASSDPGDMMPFFQAQAMASRAESAPIFR